MTAIELPKPTIKTRDRSMTARYDTGKIKQTHGEDWKIMFCLSVSYHKAGPNYFTGEYTKVDHFTVAVNNEEEGALGMTRFTMGSGLGVQRIEHPSNRFSRKKLKEIFADFTEEIEGIMSIDDESMLDERERAFREGILPYWNGEKA